MSAGPDSRCIPMRSRRWSMTSASPPSPAGLRAPPAPVLEMPAPVVADALGYHQATNAKLASQAGGTWSRYASGDHLRSPSDWAPTEN
jgi:hypothetical protein